jgi:hypothetical protein
VVLAHRRSQQRVTRSVEPKAINNAIELRQRPAQRGRRDCGLGVSIQRFR